jgi:hypothetical protein
MLRLARWTVRRAGVGVLLGFCTGCHLQAEQHITQNHISFGAIRALPEGIFVALLVAAMLAIFIAIRLSAAQRSSR